jgi:hypothetical protein
MSPRGMALIAAFGESFFDIENIHYREPAMINVTATNPRIT